MTLLAKKANAPAEHREVSPEHPGVAQRLGHVPRTWPCPHAAFLPPASNAQVGDWPPHLLLPLPRPPAGPSGPRSFRPHSKLHPSRPAGKPQSGDRRVSGQHVPSAPCIGASLPGAGERKGGHVGPWGLGVCSPAVGSPAQPPFLGGLPFPQSSPPHQCGLGSTLGSAEAWRVGGWETPA